MNQKLWLLLPLFCVAFAGGLWAGDDLAIDYSKRAARLAADDADGHYRLGLWCETNGMKIEARRHLRTVVVLEPDHRAARRALGFEKVHGRWVGAKDVQRAKGFVEHDGVWVTPEEYLFLAKDKIEAQRAKEARKIGNEALKMAWNRDAALRARAMSTIERLDEKYRLRPLSIAARVARPDVRMRAVKGLETLNDEHALPALYKRAVFDTEEEIRKAAAHAVKSTEAEGKIGPFVRALNSPFTRVRTHAIQALEVLGDEGAVGPLVARYQLVGGSGQSVYITTVNQISYIQDFDVEVAQTSFIADPVIGVIQDGLTLNVRVLATVGEIEVYERPALSSALSSLTGKNLGDSPRAWAAWYRDHRRMERKQARQAAAEKKAEEDS